MRNLDLTRNSTSSLPPHHIPDSRSYSATALDDQDDPDDSQGDPNDNQDGPGDIQDDSDFD